MWLQLKVPALLLMTLGIFASVRAASSFLKGSVEKYATGPSGSIVLSTGWVPQLYGILASATLIASRSRLMVPEPD